MSTSKPSFEAYYRELQRTDPDLCGEIEATLERTVARESTGGIPDEILRETIVLTTGRPVLDIRAGATVIEIDEVESQIWKQRLRDANDRIAPNIPAVGRIELANHPRGVSWVGTGWLIRDNVVATNRHVAEIFGERDGEGFTFRPGLDGSPMGASIDFLEEFDSAHSLAFPFFTIAHIERGGGPDLAFLRVEPVAGQDLPAPIALQAGPAAEGEQVAVIGYPARDPFFPDPDLMDRIFQHRYDKKRLAPGMVTGRSSQRVFHDCSTLGGNSGAEVVSLRTGRAVALHFAGTLFTTNHAVPVDLVASRLDDALRGRTAPAPAPARPQPRNGAGETQPAPAAAAAGPRSIEISIPLKVRIEIGDIAVSTPTPTATPTPRPILAPQLDEADDDLIATTEARPEDYRDRKGYDPFFLGSGVNVPLPTLTRQQADILTFTFDGALRDRLDYQHFSVVMSAGRRLCRFSACNLDGLTSKKRSRTGWQTDPRIPKAAQIQKECYGNPPKFSRGHMTRREDPVWGDDASATRGNTDSMHVTNAVPQIQLFNGGIWLDLEDYALDNARKDDMRICVFTGPFLADDDPVRFGVKIPVVFWKVIAFIHDVTGTLSATGYTMSQQSFLGEEEFVFGRHENNQRPIAEIERRAGLSFGPLADLDPLRDQDESVSTPLTDPSQIRFV